MAARGTGAARQQPFGPLDNIAGGLWLRPPVNVAGRPPFAVGGQVLVADQPVGPEVDHFDLQGVRTGAERSAYIDAERRLPKDAQVAAVEFDFSNYLDAAQVQIGSPAGRTICGQFSDL